MKQETYRWSFFIAHASADVEWAEKLFELLRPHKVFLDTRCILPGDNWGEELQLAQKKSLITVVLISSNTKAAYYQKEEIASAITMSRENKTKHRVIPLFLDEKSKKQAIPYGLLPKHALYLSSLAGIEEVASKLKETLKQTKKLGMPNIERSTEKKAPRNKLSLLEAIGKLTSDDLLSEVVEPLSQTLHPGQVEYAHLSEELPRSILSFGQDSLRRSHVLCVQTSVESLGSTSKTFKRLVEAAERVRNVGIRRENGANCIPDEVWLIAARSWNHQDRQKASAKLQLLTTAGIKFISAEELCTLLIDHLPRVASQLSKYSSPEIVNLISSLSRHREGRAFGFSTDRDINEFYVTAALSPYGTRPYAALKGEISANDFTTSVGMPLKKLLNLSEIFKTDRTLEALIKQRARDHFSKGVLNKYGVPVEVRLSQDLKTIRQNCIDYCLLDMGDITQPSEFVESLKTRASPLTQFLFVSFSDLLRELLERQRKKIIPDTHLLEQLVTELNGIMLRAFPYTELGLVKTYHLTSETKLMLQLFQQSGGLHQPVVLNRLLLHDIYSKEISPNQYLAEEFLDVTLTVRVEETFKQLQQRTKSAIRSCPGVLRQNVTLIKNAWESLRLLEDFTEDLKLQTSTIPSRGQSTTASLVRIRVPQPEHLLKLDRIVLIEGSPGCGKTTLLKILALKMLTDGGSVFYLPCSIVPKEFRNAPLKSILKKFAKGSASKSTNTKTSILILDGLDEASFDFSSRILSHASDFQNVVVSSRNSFQTSIRDKSFRVALSPFNNEERNLFFEKWFINNPALIAQAKDLIGSYPDIDIHTRLPLIATITVALLQNGMIPRTRAEIYSSRLELLLSRWDRFRGVDRLYVDNPDAKRRFLRYLAFQIHSSDNRRRQVSMNELKEIYENSLGSWGYKIDYNQLLNDLIVGSGVLMDEGGDTYSLGHLTFQEHLAAEYLAENYSTEKVSQLLGHNWWREPLNFYASVKGDITSLIDYSMNTLNYLAHIKQLAEMVIYAPYTSPGAIQIVTDSAHGVFNDESFETDTSNDDELD